MNGALDIGNTRIKWAVFEGESMVDSGVVEPQEFSQLAALHRQYRVKEWMVSSVRESLSTELGIPHVFLSEKTPLPVTNAYADPSALGKDRIAAVCGAIVVFPRKNILVIDAGTCITFDFVDKSHTYLGGSISPGIEMRLQAMNHFTQKLPLLSFETTESFIGNDTRTCMLNGVIQGVLGETERQIHLYSQKFADLQVVLCGGNTDFFEKNLKSDIFAAPNLVLTGLNNILLHQQLNA